jgi:GTP-binding protein
MMTKPIVAIVGRPNVGKSTLFNRLVGERWAIVEDVAGTTRDRICADISWDDDSFTLIDTGGLELKPTSGLRHKVKEQVQIAIAEADVIIFMVDVTEGVTIPDSEIAETLRRSQKPIVLAVNKCDNEERSQQAIEFHSLALAQPIAISAYHNTGISELMTEVVAKLPPLPPASEEPGLMKLAIVGRVNVGKSMLLNAILGQERVIVSEEPGTTRDAIDTVFSYGGEPVLVIDTAGIRKRGRVEGGIERYSVLRALRAISRADVAILVTDATEMVTAQDVHIAGYIEQAVKGMVLVVNKWDLIEGGDRAQYIREIRSRLKFMPYVPILFTSAKLRQGIEAVLAAARGIYQQRLKRLPTSSLKEAMAQAVATHAPPSIGGRQLKLRGVTQSDVNPPTFVFSVNDPKLLHFSYRRYLENSLRRSFGLSGTPIRLVFKAKGEQ